MFDWRTFLRILIVAAIILIGKATTTHARLVTIVDFDRLIEDSDYIVEATAVHVGGNPFQRWRGRHTRVSKFQIKKVLKGQETPGVIKVRYPYESAFCFDYSIQIEFDRGKDYILFLKKDSDGYYIFTFPYPQENARWPVYDGKDLVEELIPHENIDRSTLKGRLLYELGQWSLNPDAPEMFKYHLSELWANYTVSPYDDSRKFLSEYPWFAFVLKNLAKEQDDIGIRASEFLKDASATSKQHRPSRTRTVSDHVPNTSDEDAR